MAYKELDAWLKQRSGENEAVDAAADVIGRLAGAATKVSRMLARGPLNEGASDIPWRKLFEFFDEKARDIFCEALTGAPVSVVAREKGGTFEDVAGGPVALAMDSLNGSTNIDANTPVGTFFSLMPGQGEEAFLQPGSAQVAAGYFIYGPRTAAAFTFGDGTHIITMDPESGVFYLTAEHKRLPEAYEREYAVNASNYRYWDPAIRSFIDDMIDGAEGPREEDYSMRWAASLAAETSRVLNRGGIFLYPSDSRPGHLEGRLKRIFHANPVAFVIEQAGGQATDGRQRLLDQAAERMEQRAPLIFGSPREVERVARYYDLPTGGMRSPLFSRRGLFR